MSHFHHENVQALIDVHVQALIDVHVQALIGSPACNLVSYYLDLAAIFHLDVGRRN